MKSSLLLTVWPSLIDAGPPGSHSFTTSDKCHFHRGLNGREQGVQTPAPNPFGCESGSLTTRHLPVQVYANRPVMVSNIQLLNYKPKRNVQIHKTRLQTIRPFF